MADDDWPKGSISGRWKSENPTMLQAPRQFRPCPCGSGSPSWWERDARCIPLARVCDSCKDRNLAKFRPDVLSNAHYEHDEPLDED